MPLANVLDDCGTTGLSESIDANVAIPLAQTGVSLFYLPLHVRLQLLIRHPALAG